MVANDSIERLRSEQNGAEIEHKAFVDAVRGGAKEAKEEQDKMAAQTGEELASKVVDQLRVLARSPPRTPPRKSPRDDEFGQ